MVAGPAPSRPFRIASRGSALARWQAEHVARCLRSARPDQDVQIVLVRTTGDRITDVPLSRIGDRGLFTKEVDDRVLGADADAAVHSLKDLPTRLPDGLALGAVLEREDPRDVLVCADPAVRALSDLPAGARVGTSSLRRRAQLLALRPDLEAPDIRGNVGTRLGALAEGRFHALLLAAAGLHRLDRREAIAAYLDPPGWLPAVGQGALAVTCRAGDRAALGTLGTLAHAATWACVEAERALLRRLEGGCQVPIGALATVDAGRLHLHAMIAALDGSHVVRGSLDAPAEDAAPLGERLAARLAEDGGASILEEVRAAFASREEG